MSRRQPLVTLRTTARHAKPRRRFRISSFELRIPSRSAFNVVHSSSLQATQEFARLRRVKLPIARLDAQEKRLRVASANCGTLNTGWYGVGSPLSASIPKTQESAAQSIVSSKVMGMNDGQL